MELTQEECSWCGYPLTEDNLWEPFDGYQEGEEQICNMCANTSSTGPREEHKINYRLNMILEEVQKLSAPVKTPPEPSSKLCSCWFCQQERKRSYGMTEVRILDQNHRVTTAWICDDCECPK